MDATSIFRSEVIDIDPINGVVKTTEGEFYRQDNVRIIDDTKVVRGIVYAGCPEIIIIQVHEAPIEIRDLPA